MTTETNSSADPRAEYIAGLKQVADLFEANPRIAEMFSFALRNIQEPNLTYDEMDSLAEVGAAAGAEVSETLDDRWRNVTIAFGPVKVRGYGPIQHDPNQPCPTCGTCKPAPKPLVSDETIRQAEQISRMVAPMDLGLPQAPCGCPIKGDRVDHCAACNEAVAAK